MQPTQENLARKRKLARRMLRAGKKNKEIDAAIKKKFKTGIGSDVLAAIRVDIGIGRVDSKLSERTKIAKKMVIAGKSNDEIKKETRRQFGAGMHNTALALLRAEMREGTKPRKKKGSKSRSNGHVANGLLVLQNGNGTSAEFKTALSAVHSMMGVENVRTVQLMGDGTVRLQQDHEFTLKDGGA